MIRRDIWVKISIKPLVKYLLRGQVSQYGDLIDKNSCFHWILNAFFFPLFTLIFNLVGLVILFYVSELDGMKERDEDKW